MTLIPDNIEDEGLQVAYQEANMYTWTQEELDAYDYFYMKEADEKGRITKATRIAREEGMEKGRKEGMEKGRKEERRDLVVKAWKMNMTLEKIVALTQLSMEEVKKIIQQHKNNDF